MSGAQRILVVSHGHPDFSLGGGEIAAYRLFTGYRANPQVEAAWFLGRVDRRKGWPTGQISLRREDEYLWDQAVHNWHLMTAVHTDSVTGRFAELLRALRPTVVHVHHYAHLGLEFLALIKRVDPSIRIVLTLHEYMAICRQNGQMVKARTGELCRRSGFDDCNRCFPETSAEGFWMRKQRFSEYFALVDRFVAPSEFLRQRYIDWGLDPARIVMLENGQEDAATLPPRPLAEGSGRVRFGFFGQVSAFKGIDVLLKALALLPRGNRAGVQVDINCAHLEQQTPELQAHLKELAEPLIRQGLLHWAGPYAPGEQASRMAGVDWVIVPSIWWENSPMIIQEAFVFGRPVICANIGGMAEKVRHGIDGLHFQVGNPHHLAETLLECAGSTTLWETLASGIRRPPTVAESTAEHLALLEG